MIKQIDDEQASGRLLLLALILLLVLVASTHRHDQDLRSPEASGRTLANQDNHDAIAACTVRYVAVLKHYDTDSRNNILIPISKRNQLSDYNRKLALYFILNRIDGFSRRPACREIYLNLPCNKDDIPFLS